MCEKELISLEEIQKIHFNLSMRAFPEHNKLLPYTEEICVSTCMLSSFPHGLSNRQLFNGGDSTMINVLISKVQTLFLFLLLLINKRQIKCQLSLKVLTFCRYLKEMR